MVKWLSLILSFVKLLQLKISDIKIKIYFIFLFTLKPFKIGMF